MISGRLAEILGALSIATDLAAGQPIATGLSATVLATRIGRRLGLGEDALTGIYYACITRRIGCTSTAGEAATLALGDERSLNQALNLSDLNDPDSMRLYLDQHLPPGSSDDSRIAAIDGLITNRAQLCHVADAHCVQAVALTRRMPLPDRVPELLSQVDARWDGGNPIRLAGDAIPLGTRIFEFAVIAELHRRAGGTESMLDVARQRSGSQFDPFICTCFADNVVELLADFGTTLEWDLYLRSEPGEPRTISAAQFRAVAEAFADFTDNKSRHFLGHSRRVAALAFGAAVAEGLPEADCQAIFDAALVHDIGRAAVRNGIWDKTEPLSAFEADEAQTYSFHTEKILSMTGVFAPIAEAASSVHERSDGSGYHRGIRLTGRHACLLAAANLYDELTHDQARRPAVDREDAATALLAEASSGRLPADSVCSVLDFAGHSHSRTVALRPDGLTKREAEVLVEISRGLTSGEIANRFSISSKTVDKHTENLFRKIGVRSRTAAALYAMEKGLLRD